MKDHMKAALEKAAIEWDKESPDDQFAIEIFDDGFKRGWKAALSAVPAELSSNPLQLPAQEPVSSNELLKQESKWIPIETAPKDGTVIILWNGHHGFKSTVGAGYWRNELKYREDLCRADRGSEFHPVSMSSHSQFNVLN